MLHLILVIAIIGFVVWLITNYIPMPSPFREIIWVIAVIALLLILLNFVGVSLN